MASIIDEFKIRTEKDPNKLLYAFLDIQGKVTQAYTYREFLDRTTDIASHIHRTHPLKPGERVLLVYPPGLEMICAFFACVRLGLIPVPVYPPTEHGFQSALYKMTFIAKDCGAAAVLTDRSYYWSMKLNLARTKISTFSFKSDWVSQLKWIVSSDAGTNRGVTFPEVHSDILFLQYTSGSTSEPKGVMVTHENVIHNSNNVVDHIPVGVSWLPQYHDMGLIGYYLFFALKGGTTYGFSPLDFIQRPALWLESISKFKGTASSAPNFAYAYCLKPGKIPESTLENLDLRSLQFLMTAAEPVRTDTYRQFLKKFEPYGLNAKSFFSAYGLAEYTLAVSNYGRTVGSFEAASLQENVAKLADADATGTQVTSLLSCGKPLGNTEIKIVDASKTPREVKDGNVGEIWITGDCKCKGYWNRPALSQQIFEAQGEGTLTSALWLRTGDLGFVHEGELYICGRSKDLIIVRGLNYYPQDIENIVEEDPAIRKGCVAAFSIKENGQEVLVIVAELKNPKVIPDPHQINKKVLQFVGIGAGTIVYIQPRTIPKTSSGKIMRHKVKSLFEEKDLKIVYHNQSLSSTKGPDDSGKATKLNDHGDDLHDVFQKYGLDTSDDKETLSDIGLDSMKLAELTQDIKSYLERKGFVDLSRQIAINVIQRITIFELNEILRGLGTASIQSKLRFKQAFQNLQRDHKEMEQALMRRDVETSFEATRNASKVPTNSFNGNIFLTGGTGFFGPFLLKSLLEQTKEDIYVLVRADDLNSGMNRLREAFSETGFGDGLQRDFEVRVRPVCGDLSRPRLGLTQTQWDALANDVHTIYNNGALVNYLFDYESMRHANVNGTNEIIQLACHGRPKILNHISTTFIFGWSVKETLLESDTNKTMDALDFGYSQSKWVSEQIIKNAMDFGVEVRIFRPALISPSVKGGGYNIDISIRLLAFMLKHGVGTSAMNQVSFVPADIAANNIVAISTIKESIGKTFHVTRDEYSSMKDVTDLLGNLTGVNFKHYNLHDFVPEVVSRCSTDDLLFPLLNFLVRSVDNIQSMEFKRYDNSNYKKYRDQSPWGNQDPKLADVVSGILRFMERQGIVEASPVKENHV